MGDGGKPVALQQDPWGELRALGRRLAMLGLFLLSAAIDLAFLGLWVGVHQVAQRGFKWLGTLPGLNGVVVIAIEIIFNTSILTVIVAYITRDLVLTVQRIWRQR